MMEQKKSSKSTYKLQVIAQIITIQLIVDKEKYLTQRLVCVLFLDNNLHLNGN